MKFFTNELTSPNLFPPPPKLTNTESARQTIEKIGESKYFLLIIFNLYSKIDKEIIFNRYIKRCLVMKNIIMMFSYLNGHKTGLIAILFFLF